MPHASQYSFIGALRIFSLAVALISCSLGIVLGWDSNHPQPLLALLLLLGGLLAQMGMNLVNDVEDLGQHASGTFSGHTRNRIHFNKRIGWFAFAISALIGAYLISLRGWPLFTILLLSAFLALNYNAGPINFKHRGIAIIQVFILMGPTMVEACYFVMTGHFSWQVLWLSLPVSLLISLLLLSNEIRDFEYDIEANIGTFSTRIGLHKAQNTYWLLILIALLLIPVYAYIGWLSNTFFILPAIIMLPSLKRHLYADERHRLTPLSGQFFLVFGIAYLLMVTPMATL